MSMTGAQSAAFYAATGNTQTPSSVSTVITSIVIVLVFIFAGWLMMKAMASLSRGDTRVSDMFGIGLRVSVLIAFAIWWVN